MRQALGVRLYRSVRSKEAPGASNRQLFPHRSDRFAPVRILNSAQVPTDRSIETADSSYPALIHPTMQNEGS